MRGKKQRVIRGLAYLAHWFRTDVGYALVLTTGFLMVGTLGAIHHEMWRNEMQAWLLGRDSASFIDLLRNLRYEGHPGLWHTFLLLLSRITWSPSIMQGFHLLIAATSVFLVARYAPFDRFQKLLFGFGYFTIYQYAIVSRNYALGVLLICVFCVLFRHRTRRFLWIAVVLFLLAHTSVHALIIAIAITIGLMFDFLFLPKRDPQASDMSPWRVWLGFGLIVAGILTSVLLLMPPADSAYKVGWMTQFDFAHLRKVLGAVTRAFLPTPRPDVHFYWGPNWLETFAIFRKIQPILALGLVGWFMLVLLRKPTALLIYVTGTLGLLTFFYVKYFGHMRHHGFLFLLFVLAAWIHRECAEPQGLAHVRRISARWGNSLGPLLTVILVVQAIGGFTALRMDYRYVFSSGKAAAEYIRAQELQGTLMVGHQDFAAKTVVGYLERDQAYYPRGHRYGSFLILDKARAEDVSDPEMLTEAIQLGQDAEDDVLFVLNHALDAKLVREHRLKTLRSFVGSTLPDEDFHLYLLAYETQQPQGDTTAGERAR